jgi:hypothetical protein
MVLCQYVSTDMVGSHVPHETSKACKRTLQNVNQNNDLLHSKKL